MVVKRNLGEEKRRRSKESDDKIERRIAIARVKSTKQDSFRRQGTSMMQVEDLTLQGLGSTERGCEGKQVGSFHNLN